MLIDNIKTEKFAMAFSALLGFAIIAIAIPTCKGDDCVIKKAPSPAEMKTTTWKLGKKCYQFRSETKSCPATGVIEAFVEKKNKLP